MTFTPDVDFAYSTTYSVTIGTIAEDLAGNPLADDFTWDFTTGAEPDTTAPTVTGSTPTGTDVPVSTTITVTFDEAMNEASVEGAFFIDDPSVTGTTSWAGNTMTFTPDANLGYSTTYTVTIGTGATDLAGNPLAAEYIWDFTTVEEAVPIVTITDWTLAATAARGTSIDATVTIENTGDDTLWFVVSVSGTQATTGYPIVGLGTVQLAAGDSISVPVKIVVPGSADEGDYTLTPTVYKLEDYPTGDLQAIGSGKSVTIS